MKEILGNIINSDNACKSIFGICYPAGIIVPGDSVFYIIIDCIGIKVSLLINQFNITCYNWLFHFSRRKTGNYQKDQEYLPVRYVSY